MSENKEVSGQLQSIEAIPFTKGTEQKLRYKYKIDGRTYSGFINYDHLLTKMVNVIYFEKPNESYPDNPYKNVIKIEEISATEVVASPQEDAKCAQSEPKSFEQQMAENPAFYGMVFNQTCEQLRFLRKPQNTENTSSYSEHFDRVFMLLWTIAVRKRKEVLNSETK